MTGLGGWIAFIVIATIFVFFFCYWIKLCWQAGDELGHSIKQASIPVPSPAQIAEALGQEWGRPATVQEVCAVHQMLQSEHNQAMLNSGIGLGAAYLLLRAA